MNLREVKPRSSGWYYVTLFQDKKIHPDDPDTFREWVEFTYGEWDYGIALKDCRVILIHKKEQPDEQLIRRA